MKIDYMTARGDILPLTENRYFHFLNLNGQTSATASISAVTIGGIDGDSVNNMQAMPRTVDLTLRIKSGVNVEDAKREILRFVKLKQNASLIWSQNERTVRIDGYVESITMPRWNNGVTMQISLHCSQPFWEDIDFVITQINETLDLHYFTNVDGDMLWFPEAGRPLGEFDVSRTKNFLNTGDVDTGIEIEIIAFDTVTNPLIYDTFGNFFGVGYGDGAKKVTMTLGDTILINTTKGKKSVTLNGVSLLDKVKPQSTWLQLVAGYNVFSVNSEDESLTNMSFNLIYKQRYV